MSDPLRHLPLPRLEPVNTRRTKRGFSNRYLPNDPVEHARKLGEELNRRIETASTTQTGAFDPRLLMKVEVVGLQPKGLEAVPGLQLVSQEGKSVVVLFANA